jgi:hypothetical protein
MEGKNMNKVCGLKTTRQGFCVFVTQDYCSSVCQEDSQKCKNITEAERLRLNKQAEQELAAWI